MCGCFCDCTNRPENEQCVSCETGYHKYSSKNTPKIKANGNGNGSRSYEQEVKVPQLVVAEAAQTIMCFDCCRETTVRIEINKKGKREKLHRCPSCRKVIARLHV
jgi:hypothetical protein